jgi:hypothetical protein
MEKYINRKKPNASTALQAFIRQRNSILLLQTQDHLMAGRAVTFNINSFREILKYYPAITNL